MKSKFMRMVARFVSGGEDRERINPAPSSRFANSSRCSSVRSMSGSDIDSDGEENANLAPVDVPEGCLAVYVGTERQRYVIAAQYLNHTLFRALLERSAEEFGFEHKGGLTIACEPVLFEHMLYLIKVSEEPKGRFSRKQRVEVIVLS